jgi:hypothetical protein
VATSDFLPFGTGAGAKVLDQADYLALAARSAGFSSGVAKSIELNKVWRQSSIMSAVLAQLIVDLSGQNAVDDGTTATLLANLKAALGGRLLRTTVYTLVGGVQMVSVNGGAFTATGATTFTPQSLMAFSEVEVLGGGGAGGGAPITGSNQIGGGSGGNAGGYGVSRYTAAQIGASQLITVGAGGLGVSGNTGSSGGTSSFGSLLTCQGGNGGNRYGPTSPPINSGTGIGGLGGVTGANVLSCPGAIAPCPSFITSLGVGWSGPGAASQFGRGGNLANGSSNGVDAAGYGSGGSGACALASNASALTGGAGSGGFVLIREYA